MSKCEDYERENYAARYDKGSGANGVESVVMMLSIILKKQPNEVNIKTFYFLLKAKNGLANFV